MQLQRRGVFDPDSHDPLAAVVCTGCLDVKKIEQAPGEVIQMIPLCSVSGGVIRRTLGWFTDDEMQMSRSVPSYAVPLAATVITHLPSFLIVQGLFFLARRDISYFYVPFATLFVDLIRHIDEQWNMLVSCIKDGRIPNLEGIDDVRGHLQAHFHANPERAGELLEIGPPFSSEGWFARVWPNVRELKTVCSGQFFTVLPKVNFILGLNVSVRCPGYGSSEAIIGIPHDVNKLDEFVVEGDHDIVEFLDISKDETHENICQPWEVQVGNRYEPIVTTRDGLWRYRMGDVVEIVGFDTKNSSPMFKYSGRRWLTIRLQDVQITDDQVLAAIKAFSSEETIQVQEFTTMIDERASQPTMGFLVELAGPLGPDAHVARKKLFDALVATNAEHQRLLEHGHICLPMIRIIKAGTFAEYRQWKSKTANIASAQIKVPLIVVDPADQERLLKRVVDGLC